MAENNGKKRAKRPPDGQMLRRTLVLMIVCGIAAFIVLAGRLYQLQIIDHDEYESRAIDQQVRETSINSGRGTIYDRNMKILAMSASADTVYISPAEIVRYGEDPNMIAAGLSEILGVDYSEILEMTKDTKSWYKTVARKLDEETTDKVREFKNENELVGVKIEPDSKRYYPYGSLACHIVGVVGFENTGLMGIESSYDEVLTGVSGRVVRAKNAQGTDMLYTKYEDYIDAEDGCDLVLTVDSTIQYYLEKHLEQAVESYDIQNGAAAICMDVNTGGILGLASLGNFDLNNYQQVSEQAQEEIDETDDPAVKDSLLYQAQQLQWRDKAISDTYEPGSTFKIITLAMALEEGVAHLDDSYYCGGSMAVVGREPDNPVNCWKTAGHGAQTLTQAVQHSCNVAFVQLGLAIGAERFYDYVDAFGFFDKTGIELSGEGSSIWWPSSAFMASYDKSSLAAASFGQTFNITPLQLVTAVSACANGGKLMQPYIVSEILDGDGNTVSKTEPKVVRQVISEETSREVCEILEKVVCDPVDGTGKNAYVSGYRIGGKTGTSTDTYVETTEGRKEYIVSFIAVAPADDPQVCLLVLLDNPSSESGVYASGGNMGAPTVGNMLADILPYLGVEPEYTDEELKNMDKTVPNITGLSADQAIQAVVEAGLSYRQIGSGGTVTAQLPAANTVIAANSEVIIYLGAEPSEEMQDMPDLTGLSYSIARQRLGFYGLFIKTNSHNIQDAESILVYDQSIEPGELVKPGTVVEVALSQTDASMLGRY